ncbi:hypothetical protein [Gemmatimonas sp.]|uniref:hypothetical protein n=1 Tax=Gemmatimonas sp. TaxID=1962908 RepID=UPI00356450B4
MTLPIDTTVSPDDASQALLIETADVAALDGLAPETVSVDVPDRADAPVSEITERFLKVVLAHVPLARIEELHLFSPLRQGGVETGIAVIAARVPVVVVEQPETPELPLDDAVAPLESTVELSEADDVVADDLVPDDVVADDELDDVDVLADVLAEADDEVVSALTPTPRIRHTVYTARYRLVQKGPERGKWEADVVAEAEAPLITVDLVVRGVQRRAGEDSEIVRYTAPQLARALRVPYSTV